MAGMLKDRPTTTASVSDKADRALLPEGLRNARIVSRNWGTWTVADFFGTHWDVTFGLDFEAPGIVLAAGEDPEYVVVDYTQN